MVPKPVYMINFTLENDENFVQYMETIENLFLYVSNQT